MKEEGTILKNRIDSSENDYQEDGNAAPAVIKKNETQSRAEVPRYMGSSCGNGAPVSV
jgi:hypothetical protein